MLRPNSRHPFREALDASLSSLVRCRAVVCDLRNPGGGRARTRSRPRSSPTAGFCCSTARPISAGRPASKANWKVADGAISVSSGREGPAAHDQPVRRLRAQGRFPQPKRNQQRHLSAHAGRAHRPGRRLLRAEHRRRVSAARFPPAASSIARRPAHAATSTDWRTFTVKAEGGHFTVSSTASKVLDYIDPKPLGRGLHRPAIQLGTGRVSQRQAQAAGRWNRSSTAAT